MARYLGAFAVLVGTAIVGFSPNRWDTVIVHLSRGHGIHAHEALGMVFVVVGIALLWRGSRSR